MLAEFNMSTTKQTSVNFWRLWLRSYLFARLRRFTLKLSKFTKGVFTGHRGDFRAGARSLQFPLMALQNVMPARVTRAWVHLRAFSILRNRLTRSLTQARVHPGCCTGERISPRNETSQRYSVNAKRPPVLVWNRSTGGPERVGHAINVCDFEWHVHFINIKCTLK